MQVSLVDPTELSSVELQAWRVMQQNTQRLMNPFLCPEFSVGVAKFRTNAQVAVLTEGSELVGFFPFERRPFGIGVPIGRSLSNSQGLIHSPSLVWDARELLQACKLYSWQFNNLLAEQLPFERYAVAPAPAAMIDLTDGFDAYREKLQIKSSRFLKTLDRRTRNLHREVGAPHLVSDSHDRELLHTLIGWKSDQCRRNGWGTIFDRSWVLDLINYLFNIRNDVFGVNLSMLYAGEVPIAGQLGLRAGHFFAGWIIAYDAGFSRYSPGLIHIMRMAEHLAAVGVRHIDMGGPSDFKNKLKNGDINFTSGMITRGPLPAAAHRMRANSAKWACQQIKRYPPVLRLADRTLGRYG